MAIVDAIIMELDQEASTTRRVLERVPEDKLSWRPHPKSFSLGQLAQHIAGGQKQIAKIATEDVHELGIVDPAQATSRQELLQTFDESTASAKDTLREMDDKTILSTWTLKKNGATVLAMPRVA